jgi:tetratricopeptide (TPR) repeat protein
MTERPPMVHGRVVWSTRRVRTLFAVVGLLHISATALAQSDEVERAKASFKAGATAYAAGEYLAAIQALDAAYALTPIPAIAFSLAQAERRQYFVAHEREHLERAVLLFRRYVEQVPTGGRRADALDALSQLEPLAALPPSGPATPTATDVDAIRRTRLMITSEAFRSTAGLPHPPR